MSLLDETFSVVARFSNQELEKALQELIGSDLVLMGRGPDDYLSTHPIEDVSVSVGDDVLDLFCKYSPTRIEPLTGHSRGAAYEGSVYRHVFPNSDLSTPNCYGTFQISDGIHCIVLEHVSGYRIDHSVYPRGLVEACHDLARFHSRSVRSLQVGHNVFGRSHFSRLVSEVELLPGVASRLAGTGSKVVDVLSNARRSIIHGELYPKNILINDLGIVITDWESAGIGPGVLDFAVLTQGSWDLDLVDECEEVYWRERGDLDSAWVRKYMAAARIIAAGQLLLHLRAKETDGVQEDIAMATIASQALVLSG